MPLNNYQKHILRDFRVEEQIYGLQFITLTTGSGFSALDAYRKQTWTETTSYFSGALLWNPYSNKRDTEGGFTKLSDVVIVASRDNRDKAQSKDAKVVCDGIKFRIGRIVDCEDTHEIIIYASRLE